MGNSILVEQSWGCVGLHIVELYVLYNQLGKIEFLIKAVTYIYKTNIMEETIKTHLQNRGFQYQEIVETNLNIDDCKVKYLCICGNEQVKMWSIAKKVGICGVCNGNKKNAVNDAKYIALGKSLGFDVIDIKREKTKHKTKATITYKCKCGNTDSVTLPTFTKKNFAGCKDCKLNNADEIYRAHAEERGYKLLQVRRDNINDHTRTFVDVLCKCGNPCDNIKLEHFNSDMFRGCDSCTLNSKSVLIKQSLSGGESVVKTLIEDLKNKGFTNLSASSDIIRGCKIKYSCTCGDAVEKTYVSVKSNPLCQKCINKNKKNEKDNEIADFVNGKGYTYIQAKRDETDKNRIYVKFVCKCGITTRKQWEVIRRDEFTGCGNCFSIHTSDTFAKVTQTDSAVKKRIATNKAKYGGISSLSSPEIREKARNTMIEKLGVENPSQSPDIHIQQHNFDIYTSDSGKEYKCQGHEKFALRRLINKDKIPEDKIFTCHELCSTGSMPSFEYTTDDGKNHVYFPDIRITNQDGTYQFIEVKSTSDIHSINLDLKIKSVTNKGYNITVMRFNRIGSIMESKTYNPD